MPRNKVKDGVRVSLYIDRDLWEQAIKAKPPHMSNSEFVEMVLRAYTSNSIVTENIINEVKENIQEGKEWGEVLDDSGITDPKMRVKITDMLTEHIPGDKRVLKLKFEDFFLVAQHGANSYFGYKVRRKRH